LLDAFQYLCGDLTSLDGFQRNAQIAGFKPAPWPGAMALRDEDPAPSFVGTLAGRAYAIRARMLIKSEPDSTAFFCEVATEGPDEISVAAIPKWLGVEREIRLSSLDLTPGQFADIYTYETVGGRRLTVSNREEARFNRAAAEGRLVRVDVSESPTLWSSIRVIRWIDVRKSGSAITP
jgi:hypothetical protein